MGIMILLPKDARLIGTTKHRNPARSTSRPGPKGAAGWPRNVLAADDFSSRLGAICVGS